MSQEIIGVIDKQEILIPGPPGQDGKDAESAYEIAVRNGFIGTEEEWLESLVGSDGKDGNILYAAFERLGNDLIMVTPDDYAGPTFAIENKDLVVIV